MNVYEAATFDCLYAAASAAARQRTVRRFAVLRKPPNGSIYLRCHKLPQSPALGGWTTVQVGGPFALTDCLYRLLS